MDDNGKKSLLSAIRPPGDKLLGTKAVPEKDHHRRVETLVFGCLETVVP